MKKFVLSIILILSLLFLFLFWGGSFFTDLSINNKVQSLRDSINFGSKSIFTFDQIKAKHPLIQDYFKTVIADSASIPKFLTVNQTAQFKTDLDADWVPLTARQYFTTEQPNFLWDSEMKTSEFFWMKAIDSYIEGKGNMLIKLNSSVTIADSWGLELDKSGLFRYISEAVLFPTKLLPAENLEWSILDSNLAEIRFIHKDISVVAKLFFNSESLITKIETFDKYRSMTDGYEKSLYTIYLSDYKYFSKYFLVPSYIEVEWDINGEKFKYGKFRIEDIKYE